MKLWDSDEDLFGIARRELFTCVVGDVMDKNGLQHQFLPPEIKPLSADMIVVGRAMPVLEADVFVETHVESANPLMSEAFGLLFRALDDLKANEVYLCTGASPRYALWGGLMSIRARHLGASGVVVNGYIRDTKEILRLGFPTFAYGSYGQDQGPRGKVIDFRVPLEIGGVRINPGDIIFGDLDGVCVIPRETEDDIFHLALEKARGEQVVRASLEAGMSASEAFTTYHLM